MVHPHRVFVCTNLANYKWNRSKLFHHFIATWQPMKVLQCSCHYAGPYQQTKPYHCFISTIHNFNIGLIMWERRERFTCRLSLTIADYSPNDRFPYRYVSTRVYRTHVYYTWSTKTKQLILFPFTNCSNNWYFQHNNLSLYLIVK